MRKTIAIFMLCLLLLCITACGDNIRRNTIQFASDEEMLQYLEGMWVVDDNATEKTYYIFQDGQIYNTSDSMYSSQVNSILKNTLSSDGYDALSLQNFESVSKKIYLDYVAIKPNPIALFPQKGEIKLNAGESYEVSIIITKNSVFLETTATENSVKMSKISDAKDFSTVHFEELFNNIRDNFPVPASYFWMNAKDYAEVVKTIIPSFDWWALTEIGSDYSIYEPNEAITSIAGSSLTVTDTRLILDYELTISSWDNKMPAIYLDYNSEEGTFSVKELNNSSVDLLKWVAYGGSAIESFPGIPTDLLDLYNSIANAESKFSDGVETKEYTLNGLTFVFSKTTDGSWSQFTIKSGKTIPLGNLLKANKQPETTTPAQKGTLDQLLDGTKSWVGKWQFEGWQYNIHFVFKEDGTCYSALSENELFGAGKGTYTVDDNTLSIEITTNGSTRSAIYVFDPNTFSLKVTSENGIWAKHGDVIALQEDLDNDAAKIENWGNIFSKGSLDDSEEWE